MNEQDKANIKRFMDNESLAESVRKSITSSFLKPKSGRDVYQLAGVTIAVGLLDEAFKDMEKSKSITENEIKKVVQVGL